MFVTMLVILHFMLETRTEKVSFKDSMPATERFESNYMKLSDDKCHLLLSSYKHGVIGQSQIWESKEQKLVGVIIFYMILELCALARVCKFLNLDYRRSFMKAFIESQFAYYPPVWMFCSRSSNNCINRLHERALIIVYNDYSSTFEDVLVKDNSVSIHRMNIRF